MAFIQHVDSPLGGIILSADGKALTGLWFEGQRYMDERMILSSEERALPVFDETRRWLDVYFSGREPGFTPALALHASAFRMMVWQILLTIPYGEVTTYGEIARRVAAGMNRPRMSAQAVGGAVGYNPISLIVPCHRVVGADGSLTGYAGGTERKARLLELEQTGRIG